MSGDCPDPLVPVPPAPVVPGTVILHEMVMEVARLSTILGLDGGWGNVDGSGVRWKMMLGLVGFSTESEADHEVSPLSELAVQV